MIGASSPEWLSEKTWLERQIAAAQRTLESPDLSETQTALLRGEIGAWRRRIALAEGGAPGAAAAGSPGKTRLAYP
jgi:hypothetical protein